MIQYIAHTSTAYYGGVTVRLRTKTNQKYASSLSIYIDMDTCGSMFEITCGAATLFDKYSIKLRELKEKYYPEDDEYDSVCCCQQVSSPTRGDIKS